MKKASVYFFRLRIQLAIIMSLFAGYSPGQPRADEYLILKAGKRYVYQDNLYKKNELKEIIYGSHDSQAIKDFKEYRCYRIVGPFLIMGGSIMTIVGLSHQLNADLESSLITIFGFGTKELQPSNTGNIIVGIGAGIISVGIIFSVTASPVFKKSIQRFNSIQIGQQNISVKIMTEQECLGVCLVWQINSH